MIVNKFGLFALLVVLLSISGGECKRRHTSGFSGGLTGGILGRVIANKISKPKPKEEYTFLYQSYAPQPINNYQPPAGLPPGSLPPAGLPITPVHAQVLQSAPAVMNAPVMIAPVSNATGPILQNTPAYPGQAPVATIKKSSSATAIIFYPSFYGIVGLITYFCGKAYRLIL